MEFPEKEMETANADTVICIKDAYKSYGTHKVLDGLDLAVYPGTIYALLGPSGCGKTTLVSSIVGRCELDSGLISSSLKDLNDIGYMPQEISLFTILSVEEIMKYYGYLYNMGADEIKRRLKHLCDMLDLPPVSRSVANMSGGQQRRVSLAVALLHDPKVLILDEPTVGLDPILSKNLWDRLKEMSLQGKTVILTTHYIEEARQADTIGLMRNGRMLTQNSPGALLQMYNTEYLEDVFLALCYKDNDLCSTIPLEKKLSSSKTRTFDKPKKISLPRIKATLLKNFYVAKRNFVMTIFAFIIPVVLEGCAKIAFSHDPYHLPLALVNEEFAGSLQNCPRSFTNSCILTNNEMMASCVFINELRDRTYEMTEYSNYDDYVMDQHKKRHKGVVQIPSNFTESLSKRVMDGIADAKISLVKSSTIYVLVENQDSVIRDQIQKDLVEAYKQMMERTVEICTDLIQPGALADPLQLMDPVFGDKSWNLFVGFLLGLNTVCILFFSVIFSAATMLDEKGEGSLDRVLSVGVSMWDIVISHTIQHWITAVVYSLELYFFMYYIFDVPMEGSSSLLLIVFIVTGLTGVFLGGVVGLLTEHLLVAVNAAVGFNFSFLCMTGLIWPIEGAHETLRNIMPYFPLTCAISAVRDIAIKGYGLTSPLVAKGFSLVVFYMFASLLLEIIVVKTRKGAWNTKK